MQISVRTSSRDDTRALGAAVAGILAAGDVVSLTGELGAGKTSFVQGAARGLGVEANVVSPTFNLVREYTGRLHVYHVDIYRLDRLQEVIDLGLEEMLDADGVTFIEWGDAVASLLGSGYLEISFVAPDAANEDLRRIEITAGGPRWNGRTAGLRAATNDWAAE